MKVRERRVRLDGLACLVAMTIVHAAEGDSMNPLAERYVKLVLAMGQHDTDYVDAYYGPPEWRKKSEPAKRASAKSTRGAALAAALAIGRRRRELGGRDWSGSVTST